MRRALITGITGQDGFYLSEHLLAQGYEVYGLIRGQANPKRPLLERTLPDVHIVDGDLLDQASLMNIVQKVKPDEVYNLAAISFVHAVVEPAGADRRDHRDWARCACWRRSG